MMVYGSKDSVIPESIKNRNKRLLKVEDTYLIIKDGLHTLLDPKQESERKAFKQLLDQSSKFLERII